MHLHQRWLVRDDLGVYQVQCPQGAGAPGGNEEIVMVRILMGVIAVLIGLWLVFTVMRAFSAFMHLAMIIAVIVVALSLFSALRRRTES
jgi:heme A synthase